MLDNILVLHRIITELKSADKKSLIDIVNSAEANESVLREQFVNAVNNVDIGIISLATTATWETILANVPNIKTGKKFATGSTNISSPPNSDNYYTITTNLDFKPTVLFVKYKVSGGGITASQSSFGFMKLGPVYGYSFTALNIIDKNSFKVKIDNKSSTSYSHELEWYALE